MKILAGADRPHLTAILILLMAATPLAEACSCISAPAISVALAQSDFVIHGRCVSFSIKSATLRVARFEVMRLFKGKIRKRIVEISTGINSASCGFSFVAGNYYLVYGNADDGLFGTSICTRTKELYHAEDDAEYVALGLMIDSPSEKWKDFDLPQDPQDPFMRSKSEK